MSYIKIYEDIPQVKANGNIVEIFLKTNEKEFTFNSKGEAKKFVDSVIQYFTGKTKVERNAEKVKNSIHLVDDTLGIDSVSVVGNAIKNGVNGVVNNLTGAIGKGAKGIGNLFKKKK